MSRLTKGMDVHPGAVWIWRDATERWPQRTCSFCGSVMPEDFASWLSKGNDASGSEWKHGWPHKFYISDDNGLEWKFYSEHLTPLGSEEFSATTTLLADVLKIRFEYDAADRMLVRAPSYGYQMWVSKGVQHGGAVPDSGDKAWEAELNTEMTGD